MDRRLCRAVTVGILAVCCASAAHASTLAYWRHEEGSVGGFIPAGPDTVLDSSGNGYNMRTFDPTFTSATYSASVSPLKLRSGLPNTMSLDFGPGGDDPGKNDDNYSDNKPLNAVVFNAMTVELAFNMNSIGGFQALFGKDGKPLIDSPIPSFKLMVRGDDFPDAVPNQLFVEWIDGNAQIHNVASHETVQAGQWYHVAFTLSADTADLWIAKETGAYTKVASLSGNFKGESDEVMIFDNRVFSVGRGMYDNGVTDWSDAKIDEVRISDNVLTPDEFLFIPNAGLAGDANGNGRIDADDFMAIDRGMAKGLSGYANGDFNDDGVINQADYDLLNASFAAQNGYAAAAGASGVALVPEPSLLGCAAGAVIALAGRRRRRG